MDPTSLPLDPDPKPFIPNGSLKKHSAAAQPPQPAYRECLKNHAAASGGHILDGCGEFMPLPSATPADPSSLKCAACGCHRNFHRRTSQQVINHHPSDNSYSDDDEDNSDSPQPYFSSAPQMLLALSTATAGAAAPIRPITKQVEYSLDIPRPASASAAPPRKRFRTKFSAEQKGRMHALSEKIGWRMQKRADNLVEEGCKEIGIGRGVFKVWMHNNKHNYVSARMGEVGSSSSSGGGGAAGVAEVVKAENGNGGGAERSLGHMVNGGSSS